MKIKNFVAKQAVEVIAAQTKDWELALYEHHANTMIVYCVARMSSLMKEPTFEFYAQKNDALERFNDIYNIIKQ